MATLIVGNGSHAQDMLDSFHVQHPGLDFMRDIRQISHHSRVGEIRPDERVVYIAINDPTTRAAVAAELDVKDHNWVHHRAYWGSHTTVGHGTHINYNASVIRSTIGNHTTISPGVTICGDVTIGDRTLIGAGATVCDRVTIGSDVTVGAGAVVLPETVIPDGETWIGVPAKARVPDIVFYDPT
jgi:UDP-3-O-[3-hydroxymyristoyl] glucosamine N-acyltransferase